MKAFSIRSYADYNRVICWAHVIRNIDKKLAPKVIKKQQRNFIRNGIIKLQTCPNASLFKKASELFLDKIQSYSRLVKAKRPNQLLLQTRNLLNEVLVVLQNLKFLFILLLFCLSYFLFCFSLIFCCLSYFLMLYSIQ